MTAIARVAVRQLGCTTVQRQHLGPERASAGALPLVAEVAEAAAVAVVDLHVGVEQVRRVGPDMSGVITAGRAVAAAAVAAEPVVIATATGPGPVAGAVLACSGGAPPHALATARRRGRSQGRCARHSSWDRRRRPGAASLGQVITGRRRPPVRAPAGALLAPAVASRAWAVRSVVTGSPGGSRPSRRRDRPDHAGGRRRVHGLGPGGDGERRGRRVHRLVERRP